MWKNVCNFAARNRVYMCDTERLEIDLNALADEVTPLEWQLGDDFFQMPGVDQQMHGGSLHVSGSIRKAVGFYELQLHTEGTVRIACDRCLEDMDQPVEGDVCLKVRLGSGYAEEDDTVTVDEREGVLSVAWFVYESAALAIPIRHVHQLGGCNDAMMRVLSEHSAARSSDADATTTDPRWEALRGLKNSKIEKLKN